MSLSPEKEQKAVDRVMGVAVVVLTGIVILLCVSWARWIHDHPPRPDNQCQCP